MIIIAVLLEADGGGGEVLVVGGEVSVVGGVGGGGGGGSRCPPARLSRSTCDGSGRRPDSDIDPDRGSHFERRGR